MKDYTVELQYGVFGNNPEPTNYVVYEWGVWKKGSALQGQTMKSFKEMYDPTEEGLKQALKDYPSASEGFREAHNTYDHLPDEDGYVTNPDGRCFHEYDCCGCSPEY